MRLKLVYGSSSFVCTVAESMSASELYRIAKEKVDKTVYLFKVSPLRMIEETDQLPLSKIVSNMECLYLMDSPQSIAPSEEKEKSFCTSTEEVESQYGVFSILEVPSDNSCLFHSLSELFNARSSGELRKMVADAILDDPKRFAPYLETDPFSYTKWITNPSIWGGATEITIISSIYKTKVCVIDRSLQCIEFGEDFRSVVYLQYSGTHYNGIIAKDRTGKITTRFPRGDKSVLEVAKEAVRKSF